ncbi:MAG: hypothetical protein OXH75_28380 [Acidobacteria bacterium]|nr:hypothetical protein [Acidobacteriota bacterium]
MTRIALATCVALGLACVASPSEAQTRFAISYDFATLRHGAGNVDGVAVDADTRVWRAVRFAALASYTSGASKETFIDVGASRTFVGVGPRLRVGSGRVEAFAHALLGALRGAADVRVFGGSIGGSRTTFGERYGGGVDVGLGERWITRIGVDYDGATHLTIGFGARF